MIRCSNPSKQFQSYQAEIEEAVLSVLRSNNFVLGEQVAALEQEFASYIGTTDAIGVANGTDAIELTLRALDIGSGDEVITVSHTAVATVAAIEAADAIPVLIDVESEFYTLNPTQLNEVFTSKTKAVVVVHLYGQAADLDPIMAFCNEHDIFLIEDVAQAHGSKYKRKRLGSIGIAGCFSCYPTKNLGAIGDAGLISTNDVNLGKKIRMLREYGWNNRISMLAGRNSRLDELQAAILRVKLRHLDADNSKRRKLAEFYTDQLSEFPIQLPKLRAEVEPVFHLYVIQTNTRQELLEKLEEDGIQAGIHYPTPVHLQPAYQNRVRTSFNMNTSETLAQRIISLPMYPELKFTDVEKVVNVFRKYFRN